MNVRIMAAILRKDVLSLAPIVALVALLFLADPLIERLELIPEWQVYNLPMILLALVMLVMAVFQLDSPASLNDDWLCRPVGKLDLVGAKLLLVFGVVYLPRAMGAFIADLALGFSLREALLDAVLLHDKLSLFLLPIIMFAAIITRTFTQGFAVLFAIWICVFLVPTPFVRPPGPLTPGIRDELLASGMQWLAVTPARLAAVCLLGIGFWLMYWRRRFMAARTLIAVTVFAMMLFLMLPMALLPWDTTFAIQTAASPPPGADITRISLRSPRLCFPAARRADLSSDGAFVAAMQGTGLTPWDGEALRDVGPESIAFLTHVEPGGLPLDWRVRLTYVQADYSADGAPTYSLRPAEYLTGGGAGSLAHLWMLPEGAARTLRTAPSQLTLTYSLTLLKPTEFRVPTDGKRHALPGLGYCSAELDDPGNRIVVDCFNALTRPAQISAALNEIPASRVYGHGQAHGKALVDFAPRLLQWPYSERLKLAIGSPRLARHDTITVTAWEVAGHFQKSIAVPGILGGDLETCPLPTGTSRYQKTHWRDAAPHEARTISVDDGVQLEVLDFGGAGNDSPLLLLPGLGATAHSYDELAVLLAQKHRVIAMTRRGTGDSSRPDYGFDTPRLAQDVLEVMDAMKLPKVLLVGHSIAGDELTWLGAHHPERFAGLVYLDAAYDRAFDKKAPAAVRLRELNRLMPPEPPLPPEALMNYEAATKMLLERGHVRLPEGELIAARRMNDPYFAGSPTIDARTQQAIHAALEAPDYSAVKIPALAIYAFTDGALPAWYDQDDPEFMANLAERNRLLDTMKRKDIELFRTKVEKGQVLELQNSSHYIIQSNQPEVVAAIEKFAAGLAD